LGHVQRNHKYYRCNIGDGPRPVDLFDQYQVHWCCGKAQLQQAFEKLDNKVGLGLAVSQGRNWSEQCAMIIMQSYIYLRSNAQIDILVQGCLCG
ncbi:MAG: hypothetical protein ACKPKO_32760, partial [Candidatus Fonsibacter sp.]